MIMLIIIRIKEVVENESDSHTDRRVCNAIHAKKKKTILPSHRNQDWRKGKVEIEKIKKLFPNMPTDNIERNELF